MPTLFWRVFLSGFSHWYAKTRGLSTVALRSFLEKLFESDVSVPVRARNLIAAGGKGGIELYRAWKELTDQLLEMGVQGLENLFERIRATHPEEQQLYLLRRDDSPASVEVIRLLRLAGVTFRDIGKGTDFETVVHDQLPPPSLVTPENRVVIGVEAIRLHLIQRTQKRIDCGS